MPVLIEFPRSRAWDRDSSSNNCLGDAVRITGGGDRKKQNVCECSVNSVMSNSLRPYGLTVGSSVHGIHQARILEWVAISSFRESSWTRDQTPIGRRVLYPLSHLRSPRQNSQGRKNKESNMVSARDWLQSDPMQILQYKVNPTLRQAGKAFILYYHSKIERQEDGRRERNYSLQGKEQLIL